MKSLDHLKVIGDRILILPDSGQQRTSSGLYLPPTVSDREDVQGGTVVAVGPGTPLPDPDADGEPWKQERKPIRYLPMEVEVGDYALFLKKAAIEIKYRDQLFQIVPLAGILVVERDEQGIGLDELLGEDPA